jgi:hypothetical protein
MGADPVELAEIRERTKARDHRMFAGKLEKKHLSFPQRLALGVFRGLEGDFRDWAEIRPRDRTSAAGSRSAATSTFDPGRARSGDLRRPRV